MYDTKDNITTWESVLAGDVSGVRAHRTEMPLFRTKEHNDAEWLAHRLNVAAEMEKLLIDFASDKIGSFRLKQFAMKMAKTERRDVRKTGKFSIWRDE